MKRDLRAVHAKYNHTAKGRARRARYRASQKCRDNNARKNLRTNPRRLFVGERYVGVVTTPEHAAMINAYTKDRLHGFVERQSARAQVESVSEGPISSEASDRAHRLGGRHPAPGD